MSKATDKALHRKIPEDWDVLTLDEITVPDAPIRYGVVQIGPDTEGGVPIVPIKFIHQIDSSPLHRASTEIEGRYKGSRIKSGDVLLSVKATIGMVGVVPNGFKGNIAREIARIRPTKEHDSSFVAMQLQADDTQRRIDRLTVGSTRREFSIHAVRNFSIALPRLQEQKAIADLLATWDIAIDKTEKLIQSKEKLYRWLSRRLFNHNDSWTVTKLGRICSVSKGKQLNVAHMNKDGAYYALNGGIEPSGRTDDWNTEAETITISEGGNSCGYVNYNTERFWSGGHCYSLLNLKKNVDKHYLYFYLKMNELKLMKLRVGSGLPNIQKKDVDKFEVALPSLAEQQQIVQTLSAARREIDLLKQLAEKYKTQKHGLMQKMLTGIWRMPSVIIDQFSGINEGDSSNE